MNNLLITIDSLRRDHLGCYGYRRDTSPFLDSLADKNTVFRNCYAASCHTREALPAILTGKMPEESARGMKVSAPTIPEMIDGSSHAETAGCYITRNENFNRGFDSFQSDYTCGNSFLTRQMEYVARIAANRQYRTADRIIENVLEKKDRDFVWAHFMEPHAPYNKFEDQHWGDSSRRKIQKTFRKAHYFPSLISKDERQMLIDAYDSSIRTLDRELKKLLHEIPEDATVYIVGDHGELFGETGSYEHPKKLHEKLLEVPLIVKNQEDKEVKRPVSTVDISPMIT